MVLRQGGIEDIKALQQLFVETIATVCSRDYNPEQIKVWTASVNNKTRWQNCFKTQYVIVAQDKTEIKGFATLDNGNYIDFLFVSKDQQNNGVGKRLLSNIEREARRLDQTEITADVSITARPFFEKAGFKILKKQQILIGGVALTNFKMKKKLNDGKYY